MLYALEVFITCMDPREQFPRVSSIEFAMHELTTFKCNCHRLGQVFHMERYSLHWSWREPVCFSNTFSLSRLQNKYLSLQNRATFSSHRWPRVWQRKCRSHIPDILQYLSNVPPPPVLEVKCPTPGRGKGVKCPRFARGGCWCFKFIGAQSGTKKDRCYVKFSPSDLLDKSFHAKHNLGGNTRETNNIQGKLVPRVSSLGPGNEFVPTGVVLDRAETVSFALKTSTGFVFRNRYVAVLQAKRFQVTPVELKNTWSSVTACCEYKFKFS